MCGIVGVISEPGVCEDVGPDTAERLAVLEYRGYDSFGLASLVDVRSAGEDRASRQRSGGAEIRVRRAVGSIGHALAHGWMDQAPATGVALAHTRWATHGGVTEANAHPHVSFDGRVAIVHNGVIENHVALRRRLKAEGIDFASDTDSEVAAHLLAWHLDRGLDLLGALRATTGELTGEYALGVVSTVDPTAVYGAKRKSPLALAHGPGRGVLASDQMALGGLDDRVVFLEDGDVVRLTATEHVVSTGSSATAVPVARPYVRLDEGHRDVDKGDYPHWMLKEINETPQAAATAAAYPAADLTGGVVDAARAGHLALVGAGSAFYVCQIGQYLFADLAGVTAQAVSSDEAEYLLRLGRDDSLIAVSQSGETFDTLEVCRAAVAGGAVLTSISNVPNSTQERLATHRIQQRSGPEICVLSTKSIVSQVVLLARLALETGRATGALAAETYDDHMASLTRLPDTLRGLISSRAHDIQALAKQFSHVEDWFFIGRGLLYPAACESALKFKEVSYRHAEGMAAGFFKHGTISLIDSDFFTVALLPSARSAPARYAATLAAVSEIAARRGPVIGLGPDTADADDLTNFTAYIGLPTHGRDAADLVIQLVTGQLLAYYCALDLGREIDQPRGLAKSVTVR